MRAALCCLTFFTCFALAIGISLIGIGIWGLADETIPLYPARMLTAGRVEMTGLMMSLISPIVFGFSTAIPFGILVYCLCIKDVEWKNYLTGYIIVLLIIVVIQIPVMILPMAFLSTDTATNLRAGLTHSLNIDFRGLPDSYSGSSAISLLWDKTMIRDNCCGVSGTTDFTASYGIYASTWYSAFRTYTLSNGTTFTGASVKIPMACCLLKNKLILTIQDWLNMQSYLNRELCPLDTSFSAHTNGCYNIIFTYVTAYTIAIICVESFLIFTEIMALIFGVYLLCRAMDDEDIYYRYHRSKIGTITTRKVPIARTYNQDPQYDRTTQVVQYG